MAGTLTIGGMSAGLPGGQVVFGPVTTTGSNPIGEVIPVSLAAGDNVVVVPAGAVAVAIFLGQAPAVTVKVRTNLNSGDAGTPIAPVSGTPWYKQDLPAGVTEVILNSSGSLPNIQVSFI
jgi:hypothetical protein